METEKELKKRIKKSEQEATRRVFYITLSQVKKSRWLLSVLGCIILAFLLVYNAWSTKEKEKYLLFANPDLIYEQYELVKKEENNPNPIIQKKLVESKKEVIKLETAKKYNIVYQKDERASSLEHYADLKMQLEYAQDEEKKESIEESIKELETYFSSTIQERAREEIEKHEDTLAQMKQDFLDQGYKLNSLPTNLSYAIAREEKTIDFYRELLDEQIDLYHPMYAVIKQKIKLANEVWVAPKTPEEFQKNHNLYTNYNNYDEYHEDYLKENSKKFSEYYFILNVENTPNSWIPSSLEWGQSQVYTYQDGFFTIAIYGLIVTLCFTISMTSLFYKDYENETIRQYQIHINSKAYLKGKVRAATLMLILFLGIGYILIPWFATFFLPNGSNIPSVVIFLETNCIGPCPPHPHSIITFALSIYIIQLLIGVLYILILNAISMLKPPKTLLYFGTVLLVGLGISSAGLYTDYHLSFMKWLPTTYLNYNYLLGRRTYFFINELIPIYIISIAAIELLLNLQKYRLAKLNT